MSRLGPWRTPRQFNITAGTHTRDGFEPHLKVTAGPLTFHAPVMVLPPMKGEVLPRTKYDPQGRKLYALPGGAQVAV